MIFLIGWSFLETNRIWFQLDSAMKERDQSDFLMYDLSSADDEEPSSTHSDSDFYEEVRNEVGANS